MALRLHPDKNPGDEVTEADIEEFEANYRGSDSEKKDLIDLYKKCKGNMSRYTSKGIYHFYVNQISFFFFFFFFFFFVDAEKGFREYHQQIQKYRKPF
nr:chaperone protein DnaJ 6 [Ipomoea batatas]